MYIVKSLLIFFIFITSTTQNVTESELEDFNNDLKEIFDEAKLNKKYDYSEQKNGTKSDFLLSYQVKFLQMTTDLVTINKFFSFKRVIQLNIQGIGINDVKYLYQYQKGEIQLQKAIFAELILRSSHKDYSDDLGMTLIEDINQAIDEKYNFKGSQIEIQRKIENNEIIHYLLMEESLIATIQIKPKKIKQKSITKFSRNFTDYELVVSVSTHETVENNTQLTLNNFRFFVFTADKTKFTEEINKIFNLIDIQKYSNNINQHMVHLDVYLKKILPLIQTETIQINQKKQIMNIQYDHIKAKIMIEYQQNNQEDLGSYLFTSFLIKEEENMFQQFTFERQSSHSLMKLFSEKQIEELIEPLYQKIIKIIKKENYNIFIHATEELEEKNKIKGIIFQNSYIELSNSMFSFIIKPSKNFIEIRFFNYYDQNDTASKKISNSIYFDSHIEKFIINCLESCRHYFFMIQKERLQMRNDEKLEDQLK